MEDPHENQLGKIVFEFLIEYCCYSACVVYTKTIIHLSVDESGGYLPRRFAAW